KAEYLKDGRTMWHDDFKGDVHTHYTSGTTTRNPYELPWDEWAYYKCFVEPNIMKMGLLRLSSGSRGLSFISNQGIVGRAYKILSDTTDITVDFPDTHELLTIEGVTEFFNNKENYNYDFIASVPAIIIRFTELALQAGFDPKDLNISNIISGLGNFLTDSHIEYFHKYWKPKQIVESAGKAEVHSSVGGIRYSEIQPTCEPGFIHYSPMSNYTTQVDEGKRKLLLMTRLGGEGVASFVNDAADFGVVKYFTVDSPCSCGSQLPAYKLLGRRDKAPGLKFGAMIYPAEIGVTLQAASKAISIPIELGPKLRAQVVIVRGKTEADYDFINWIIGAPLEELTEEELTKVKQIVSEYPQYSYRLNAFTTKHLALTEAGQGYLIDSKFLPHVGRDKPAFPLVITTNINKENDNQSTMERYILELKENA
ncbi:hypothetical protein KC909_01960, partial [Candidatus Dojkabacteria bacterium]|nr:hypothetical protein [Candidatus Dojkabacteria bacterium]